MVNIYLIQVDDDVAKAVKDYREYIMKETPGRKRSKTRKALKK